MSRGSIPGSDASRKEIAVVMPVRGRRIWVQLRQEGGVLDGCWEFPGGKVRRGETPRAAARREMAEETGVAVSEELLEPVVTVEHDYVDRKVRVHFFKLAVETDQMAAPGEWLTFEELRERPLPAANRAAIERLLGSRQEPDLDSHGPYR